MCFCLFFITSMDSGKDCVFGGLESRDRPMTVCVCVSSTKRCRGWCAFGKAYVRVRMCVRECICAYVSVCSLYMVIFSRPSAMLYFA